MEEAFDEFAIVMCSANQLHPELFYLRKRVVIMVDKQNKDQERRSEDLILHGERVYLRRPTMDDAISVFQWENDDEIWRYDLDRPHTPSIEDFLLKFESNYVNSRGNQFWFLIENEQHISIGTITYFNLRYINHNNKLGVVEIGLGIGDKTHWGKGYGPDAISTLGKHIFENPAIVCLIAEVAPTNQPARRAFAKAGFEEIGQTQGWIQLEMWTPHGIPDVF